MLLSDLLLSDLLLSELLLSDAELLQPDLPLLQQEQPAVESQPIQDSSEVTRVPQKWLIAVYPLLELYRIRRRGTS